MSKSWAPRSGSIFLGTILIGVGVGSLMGHVWFALLIAVGASFLAIGLIGTVPDD